MAPDLLALDDDHDEVQANVMSWLA